MIQQRDALLRLLHDDDPATLGLVKSQLATRGAAGLAELRALLSAADPVAAPHIQDVIATIEEGDAEAVFSQFCSGFPERGDLEEAAWRLAATFTPGDSFRAQREQLDAWGAEVARRIAKAGSEVDRVETLVEFLSDDINLRGNQLDYYNINNSLLPEVIDTRTGIPISLALVYMLVGKRAGVQMDGVGLPGHFIVRHREHFFDPFHGGRRVGLEECRALVEQQNVPLHAEHLRPATPKQMLIRMITNIYSIAEQSDPPMAARALAWIDALRAGR
jgi:regulator of sirC expression with transglutaminase-like and TPR domain